MYDFDDPNTFDEALKGVDRIFYLSRGGDPHAASVAKPLFAKAAALGVKHIVNMSAQGVQADESVPLRQVELLLEGSGSSYESALSARRLQGCTWVVFASWATSIAMEGRNHVGAHNRGVWSIDETEGSLTVQWDNGWEHTTTRAYELSGTLEFYDCDTGKWRNTLVSFDETRKALAP